MCRAHAATGLFLVRFRSGSSARQSPQGIRAHDRETPPVRRNFPPMASTWLRNVESKRPLRFSVCASQGGTQIFAADAGGKRSLRFSVCARLAWRVFNTSAKRSCVSFLALRGSCSVKYPACRQSASARMRRDSGSSVSLLCADSTIAASDFARFAQRREMPVEALVRLACHCFAIAGPIDQVDIPLPATGQIAATRPSRMAWI